MNNTQLLAELQQTMQESPTLAMHLKAKSFRKVLVVGGGLAGAASALALSKVLGHESVTLLEARPETGGRVRSFIDQVSGEKIDNCQHLLMGCCVNLRRFTAELGLLTPWEKQKHLTFVTLDGKKSQFAADPLPAPFHLTRAFWQLHTIPMRSKIALCKAVLAMATWQDSMGDELVAHWLDQQKQGDLERKAFWEPVLVSALNDDFSRLGMRASRQVMVQAFLGGKEAFDVWLPTRPLGTLFGQELTNALINAGVEVVVDCPVQKITHENRQITGVISRNGRILTADSVVLAGSHKSSWDLLMRSGVNLPGPNWAAVLGASSITSIHLWFNRRFLPVEHAALVGCLGHWVFRKTWATPHDPYCQVLVSASDHLLTEDGESLVQKAANELLTIFATGHKADTHLIRGRVVREKSATFRQTADLDQIRPGPQTVFPGLFLAGDHTKTGWPSTMEGAVRSGLIAAKELLKSIGKTTLLEHEIIETKRSWAQWWLSPKLPN